MPRFVLGWLAIVDLTRLLLVERNAPYCPSAKE
jgi:hypothetical protein